VAPRIGNRGTIGSFRPLYYAYWYKGLKDPPMCVVSSVQYLQTKKTTPPKPLALMAYRETFRREWNVVVIEIVLGLETFDEDHRDLVVVKSDQSTSC